VTCPLSADPQVDHPGLFDRGRQTIQVFTPSPGGARSDAGAVSPEMASSVGLSDGRGQLCGAAVGDREEYRTRPAWENPALAGVAADRKRPRPNRRFLEPNRSRVEAGPVYQIA
jgi:hypothetical protein